MAAAGPAVPAWQRAFESRTLAAQHGVVAFGAAAGAAVLLALAQRNVPGLDGAPWLAWATLVGGALAAGGASVGLARRHGRALAALAESARQLRREDAPDGANLPLQREADELLQATVSLRRLVEFHRAQRQALQAMNAALGQQLQQRTHELTTLADLSVGLAGSEDMVGLVEEALKALEQTLEYTSASMWGRDRRRQGSDRKSAVVLLGYRLGEGAADEAAAAQGAVETLRGRRLSRANLQRYEQIERARSPIIENDVHQGLLSWLWERVTDDARTSALYRGSRSWMGVPLAFRDEVLGVMRVDHRSPGYFDAERARLLNAVCSQTALAMHHAQLLVQQRELAVAAERNRIARELHDAVSQTLFAANMVAGSLVKAATRLAEAGGRDATPDDRRAQDALQRQARTLERLNRGALAEMRLLMFELRPDAIEHATLAELLKPVLEAMECRGALAVHADVAAHDGLAPAQRVHLYRVAQEALSNAARHSGATEVQVHWQPDATEGALLRVADNGQGFDPQAPRPGHFGLDNLASRAAEIGAALTLTSAPGQGCEVRVCLPRPDADGVAGSAVSDVPNVSSSSPAASADPSA